MRIGCRFAGVSYTACVKITPFQQLSASGRRLLMLMFGVTLALGAFEGIYGRVRYSADAINYLNIVRAIHVGDWKTALNSYWSLGYPLLISITTPLFPASPSGEWVAVHVLNLLILAATFFSFYWLVITAARSSYLDGILASDNSERVLLVGAFTIFLSIELTMDNVSRVGPDLLVSCLVCAAIALLIKLKDSPSIGSAFALGIVLGAGYIVKAIFLPLILVFAFTALLMLWRSRPRFRYLAVMLAAAAIFAVPYIAGLSWAAGHKTYGDAGPLNYAWNVNKLEPGGLWQGQPPGYGTPIHPATMVSVSPHVYLFDGPLAVTFAPFFDPPYYYQGYRHFFNLKAQVREAGGNILRLFKALRFQFVIYLLLLFWILSRTAPDKSPSGRKIAVQLWPLLLISAAGTTMYVLVFLEARYVASFLAAALLVLLLVLIHTYPPAQQKSSLLQSPAAFVLLMLLGCGATLIATQRDSDRDVLGHAMHHQLFLNDDQWKAGIYLRQHGLHPGDKVAIMADLVSATRSTWAYMDDVQIVGILGGSLLETQTADFDAYWHAMPEKQRQIIEPFHHTGARLVLALSKPDEAVAPGWESVPGTRYWVYRF
jgi:hypothetical protein